MIFFIFRLFLAVFQVQSLFEWRRDDAEGWLLQEQHEAQVLHHAVWWRGKRLPGQNIRHHVH